MKLCDVWWWCLLVLFGGGLVSGGVVGRKPSLPTSIGLTDTPAIHGLEEIGMSAEMRRMLMNDGLYPKPIGLATYVYIIAAKITLLLFLQDSEPEGILPQDTTLVRQIQQPV